MLRVLALLALLASWCAGVVSSPTDSVTYAGTGATATYTVPFLFKNQGDLLLTENTSGSIATLVLTTNYTVVGAGLPTGGTITLTAGNLAVGTSLTIARAPPLTQLTSLPNGSPYFGSTIESALDTLCMQGQATQSQAARALQAPVGDVPTTLVLPAAQARANLFLAFDAGGNVLLTPGAFSSTTVPTSSLIQVVDTITGLKAISPPASAVTYLVRGYSAVGDGQGGIYRWNATDTTADNGNTVIIPSSAPASGRWNLVTINNTQVTAADSITALKALAIPLIPATVFVRGYSAPGDGGGGSYRWNGSDTTADNGGTVIQPGSLPSTGRWNLIVQGGVYAEQFGAKGDGSTDDTTAIDNAITYEAGLANGGMVLFNPKTYVVNALAIVSNVALAGQRTAFNGATVLQAKAGAAGCIVNTSTTVLNARISGLQFQGLGAGTACVGVDITTAKFCLIEDCFFNSFADQAILLGGIADKVVNVRAQNCLLNTSRAAKNGVLQLSGTDHYVASSEFTASITGAVSSGSLYCCAIVVSGSNDFFTSVVGEISDVGWHLSDTLSRYENCRGDLNAGHGFELAGSDQFANCTALSNGAATANTYDNWNVSGTNNLLSGCLSYLTSNTPRYGFNDTSSASDANKNRYVNCLALGSYGTGTWATTNGGPTVFFPAGPAKTLTVNSTTPSVDQYGYFLTANTSSTSVTTFTNALDGQYIQVLCLDSNTTIVNNNGVLITTTGSNVTLSSGVIYKFIKTGAIWRQIP